MTRWSGSSLLLNPGTSLLESKRVATLAEQLAMQVPEVIKLEAKGIKLTSGSKVVASVTTAEKKTMSVRFTVK